jgi:hypothetical protein
MSDLAAIQDDFQAYLLRGSQAIAGRVAGSTTVPVAVRLGIYGGAYGSRLSDALQANYAALAKLLDEDFPALAHEYVRSHDSPFFSIRYYGDQLARFLAAEEKYSGAPILAELASWEWTMSCVFDAADATPITHEALTRVRPQEWARLRFQWHPSVARLALHWNAPQLWQALSEDGARPEVCFNAEATAWLLWRAGLTTYFRSLTSIEAAVLDAARSGWPFGELCQLLCERVGDAQAPLEAATFLRGWIAAGLITDAA